MKPMWKIHLDALEHKNAKLRKGWLTKAENDLATDLGYRIQRINGEVFIVYAADQVVVEGLGGEALLQLWDTAVKQRYTINNRQAG